MKKVKNYLKLLKMLFINNYCNDFMFQEVMVCVTCSHSILSLIIFNFLLLFETRLSFTKNLTTNRECNSMLREWSYDFDLSLVFVKRGPGTISQRHLSSIVDVHQRQGYNVIITIYLKT